MKVGSTLNTITRIKCTHSIVVVCVFTQMEAILNTSSLNMVKYTTVRSETKLSSSEYLWG